MGESVLSPLMRDLDLANLYFVLSLANGTRHNNSSEFQLDTDYISLISYPILLALCTLGNWLNIILLIRLRRVHKLRVKEVLLIGLAVSDLFALLCKYIEIIMNAAWYRMKPWRGWFGLPRYLDLHAAWFGMKHSESPLLVNGLGAFHTLKPTCYYTSDGILILFSCERFMAFRWSHFHRRFRSRRRVAVISMAVVALLSTLVSLEHGVWYYVWLEQERDTASHHGPSPPADEFHPSTALAAWHTVQKEIDIILPIFILLTILSINIGLLRYLQSNLRFGSQIRSSDRRMRSDSLLDHDGSVEFRATSRASATATGISSMYRPLLGCAAVYFLTQFPAILVNTLHRLGEPPLGWAVAAAPALEKFQPVAWSLTAVNYSVNFLVYAGLSRHYRALVVDMMQDRLRKRRNAIDEGCGGGGGSGRAMVRRATADHGTEFEMALMARVRRSLPHIRTKNGRPVLDTFNSVPYSIKSTLSTKNSCDV